MDLTGVRSEPHVAQQSRREKLRVQQINSTESRRTDYLRHHSDEQQIPLRSEFSPDLVQVRSVHNANFFFDQSFLPSEMTGSYSHPSSSNLNVSSKVHQQASDWILNYGNNPWSADNNQNPAFSGEVANDSVPQTYSRPSYGHDFNFCNDNLREQDRRKNAGESQFIALPFQNTLQYVISPATIQSPVPESGQAGWSSAAELHRFPSLRNQEYLLRFENSMNWVDRSAESSGQQGLSLSLSANPPSKSPAAQLEDGHEYEDHNHSVTGKSGCLRSISKPSGISEGMGKSIQEIIGVSSSTCRNTGPLGPFTGYAIILKNSKFLKPAQQLLDEIYGKSGSSSGKTCDISETASVDVFDTIETETSANDYNLPDLRPDVQQKKAKLLHIMEEVCRRYRQHNQQMQMVVSSFESVAGLGSATPFMTTELKTVLRQFRCLKDAISDQLSQITEMSGSKIGGSCTRIRSEELSLEQCGLLQHVWRPQRGLPERAVGVLRAWLFEHFLHPYPTDADKHMLATQTGLSRNQVSNWFINARVRLWKPMVEEIHMLETKASTYANPDHPENPKTTADRQEPPGSDEGPSTGQRWAGHEKRLRVDGEASPSSLEGPLVGFVPYRRSQLGGVSLTLGLRHGVENSQQQIVLEQQNQLRRQCEEHYDRDFVG